MGFPIDDPLTVDLPRPATEDRAVFMQQSFVNTIRVLWDLVDTKPKRWFETTADSAPRHNQAVPLVRTGNEVMYLVDGTETFRALRDAMLSAAEPGQFIYILGWWLSEDLDLVAGSSVRSLLQDASDRGVEVRAMLWDQLAPDPTQNTSGVAFINGLANGRAVLDSRTRIHGAHHQKVVIVNGGDGLVAFCGGVDMNPDRVRQVTGVTGTPGSPMHDVHCRVRGPAAHSLLTVFLQRWRDHPSATGPLLGSRTPVPGAAGDQTVQITRTFSRNVDLVAPGDTSFYLHAPFGEQSARRMLLKAIASARRFIYVEDQYLVSREISDALLAALPSIEHLTILIPPDSMIDVPFLFQATYRRFLFLDPLVRAAPEKVRVFTPALDPSTPPADAHQHVYVHAKTWVFDDRFAIIGSMNCNRRGLTHDSEVNAGVTDTASDAAQTWHFAHRLRVKLWAEHLDMSSPEGHAALADGVASAVHWLKPPSTARIRPYPLPKTQPAAGNDTLWNTEVDPDGG